MWRDVIEKYCIIRTKNAGVHCGFVHDLRIEGGEGVAHLKGATRLWRWYAHADGSLSLSSVALHGAGKDSKIDGVVESITVIGVIEAIPCTPKAEAFLRQPRNNK